MQETGSASLHAGLIERARPRPSLAPGVIPLTSRVPGAEQARPGFGRKTLPPADQQSVLMPVKASVMVPQPENAIRQTPLPMAMTQRRYGLTVRVDPETRLRLVAEKERSGLTTQEILSSALQMYLNDTPGRPDSAA